MEFNKKNLLIFILIVKFIAFSYSLYGELAHISITNPDKDLFDWVQKNNIDFQIYRENIQLDIIADEEVTDYLELNNYVYEVISTETEWKRDIPGYRNYSEVTLELQDIAADYPDFTQLTTLGKSQCYLYYESEYGDSNYIDFQHEVWCIKLSDNPETNEDEPNVFFVAEIHAREPISLEVDMYILNYLVSNYGIVDSVTNWINTTQIWFIPLMNPDGHKLVTEGWHTMHRKNMRDNDGDEMPDYSSVDGVDLNRNFGYVWGNNGASNNPTSQIYHGPYAWSEPETVYARDLLRSYKFYAGVTYHSSGQWVLYPLGHLPGVCSYDHEVMGDLATAMAETIPTIYGTGHYIPAQAVDFGYTCQGTMGDWGYAEQRIFSFTIELATTYIPPESQVEEICQDNLQAALIMIDRINYATVTGNITDVHRHPLVAEIYVTEIDSVQGMTPVEPVRSDSTFGRYYRPLLPGTYTFTFHHPDYEDVVVNNVNVDSMDVTTLDITFGVSYVDSIMISIVDNSVILEWELELDCIYEVYSSIDPYEAFLLDSNGIFKSRNIWKRNIEAERMFFRVKKIQH